MSTTTTSEPNLRISTKPEFNRPMVAASWDGKPSWRAYGTGHKRIEMRLESTGALSIVAVEEAINVGSRNTLKEVWLTLPVEVVAHLRTMLNGGAK